MQRSYLPPLVIVLAVFASYGGFLYSPITFDDIKFFSDDAVNRFLEQMRPWLPRQWAYWTLMISWKWFGPLILPMRLVSLFLHAATGVTLYFFLLQISRLSRADELHSGRWILPLLAALIFVLHPVAVYGAAYLIQRTILLATLCALWSWMCLLRGLQNNRQVWVWLSVVCYALSVLAKEHAVMVPAVGVLLACWWWRSQDGGVTLRFMFERLRYVALACLIIAMLVALYQRGVLGVGYEFDVQKIDDNELPAHAWPLSVLTQGLLFFKYLGLWLLPNPAWMSADMREPFAQSLLLWPQLPGFIAFLIWPLLAAGLVWRGRRAGLVGVAMLAPWLLFATELVTVRFLEIFVLYRSYLWLAPAFVGFVALDGLIRPRILLVLLAAVPIALFPFTWNRLMTFSHPFLLWDDALRLAKDKKNIYGLHRIYVDRGVELHRLGKFDLAIQDYTRAIAIKPDFSPAFGGRASALAESGRLQQSMVDFDKAINLQPGNAIYWANKAKALESMGLVKEAGNAFQRACDIGWVLWCDKATQLIKQAEATPAPTS